MSSAVGLLGDPRSCGRFSLPAKLQPPLHLLAVSYYTRRELQSGQAARARLTHLTGEGVREVRETMAWGRNSSVPILESASTMSHRPSE